MAFLTNIGYSSENDKLPRPRTNPGKQCPMPTIANRPQSPKRSLFSIARYQLKVSAVLSGVLLSLTVGCSESPPQNNAVQTPVATASPTPVATASPTPAATASPTPAATASPSPAAPMTATNPVAPDEAIKYLQENRASLNICADFYDAAHSQRASEAYSVGEQKYLVKMSCSLAAYQESFEVLLYAKTAAGVKVTPLSLAEFVPEGAGDPTRSEIRTAGGLADYNTEERSLSIVSRSRGLGDCGTLAEYKFEGDQLELVSYRAKFECDRKFVEPNEYPQIYP